MHTRGNEDCHLVLRGADGGPNYSADDVGAARKLLRKAGLRERLVVDASHGNSRKDHERQPLVVDDVAAQVEGGNQAIVGLMLESFLEPGRQDLDPTGRLRYGQSITDACMGWETTELVLERLHAAAVARRTHGSRHRQHRHTVSPTG